MANPFSIASSPLEAVQAKTLDSVFIAGGTDLNRLGSGKASESYISIRNMPHLKEVRADDNLLRIGAACTFQDLLDNDLVPDFLKVSLRYMASRTRRNMATIGGNIALRRDDSYVIPTLIAVGATMTLFYMDNNVAKVCDIYVRDYVLRDFSDADDESKKFYASFDWDNALIVDIAIPREANVVSKRYANTAQSHAKLTFAIARQEGGCYIAFAMKKAGIHIMDKLSKKLAAKPEITEDEIVSFVKSCDCLKLEDDLIYGSAEYRRYLLGITAALSYRELA